MGVGKSNPYPLIWDVSQIKPFALTKQRHSTSGLVSPFYRPAYCQSGQEKNMNNALKEYIAASEVNFYTTSNLWVSKAHTRPSRDPNLVGLQAMRLRFARVLGEAAQYWAGNATRNIVSWGPYDLQEAERLVRLAGAMRRWTELEEGRPMASGHVEPGQGLLGPNDPAGGGFNSPYCLGPELVSALERFGYNADRLWNADQKVRRWTGADYQEAMKALRRNARPRRAAMLIRAERKHGLDFSSWAEARKFLAWCRETGRAVDYDSLTAFRESK